MNVPAEQNSSDLFRTKTGTCRIVDGHLLLDRVGVRGEAADLLVGRSSVARILALYSLVALASIGGGIAYLVLMGDVLSGAGLIALGGFFAVQVYRSRNNSVADDIPLACIQRVEAKRPLPPATRGHFIVHFEEAGAKRKRLIILPGALEGGSEEYARALIVLERAGLRPEP